MYDPSRLSGALKARSDITSMAELARRAKLRPVTVRTYFSGDRQPPLDTCNTLGRVLGVRGQWLFDGAGPRYLDEPDRPDPSAARVVVEVPLLDTVTAGRLASPGAQIPVQDVPLLAFADLGPGEFFATKVVGTSMDRISPEGSIVIVNRRDQQLVPGRCYIFAVRGETTYKRWQGERDDHPAYLEPFSTDPTHKPIFIRRKRDFEVIGRVKRTVLDL